MPAVAAALPGVLLNVAVGAAINVGVGLAINAITGGGQPTQSPGVTPSGVRLEPRVGIDVPVGAIFGLQPSPGRFLYQNSYGTDNEYLQLVYDGWRGWHEGLDGILVDNKASTLSGSNADPKGRVIDALTIGGTPYGWVKYYTGAPGQAADPELVARANPPERWPATKKLTGSAYAIVTLRFDRDRFAGNIPGFRFIWKGLRCYDRRKDSTQPGGSGPHRWGQPETYEWTANPAILQDNWRRGVWINGIRILGLGVSEHACHHARIVAAANLCDEEVTYDDTGRTLPRYAFGAELTDEMDTVSVMRMFEQSMAGFGVELGGAYAPLPAQTMIPVMTLSDTDRVVGEDVSERKRLDPTQVKTAYHGMFVSPEDGWLPKEYGLRRNAVAESADGGRRQGKLDLTMVPYQEVASTIAEIYVRRDSFQGTETAVYGPKAAKLEPGDVVTRQSAFFGTVQMMVWSIAELSAAKRRITFRLWDNSIVPDADEGFMPLPATTIPAPVPARPITVSAFLLVAVDQVSGTTTVPALRATWTPITDQTVDRVIIKYWPEADATQVRYHSVEVPSSGMAVIEGVVPETTYKATATIVTTPPRTTIWAPEQTATTGAIVVPATVPPITVEMLATEMFNRVTGTIDQMNARMAEFETQLGDLAQVVAEGETEKLEQVRGLALRSEQAAASVLRLEEVVLGPDGALAQLTESVNVIVSNVLASGYLRFTAEANEETGTVLVSIGVKATNGEWTAIASQEWGAQVTVDGAESFVRVMADRMDFISTAGVFVTRPFAIETINGEPAAKVTSLYFDNLFSTAEAEPGVPVISMIGDTGDFSITTVDP